jgi:hypothetical protein
MQTLTVRCSPSSAGLRTTFVISRRYSTPSSVIMLLWKSGPVRELLSVLSSSKICRAFRRAKLAKMGDRTLDESTADRGLWSEPCWREFSMKKGVREDWR